MARKQKVIHINSNVQGKLPTGSTGSIIDYGEIAVNYNATEPFLGILKEGKAGTGNTDFAKFSADEVLEKVFDAKYATMNDMPIVKGDAEHSAVLKGEITVLGVTYKNESLDEGCVSLGTNSKAGLRGYYFTYIDFDTNQIWLHNEQFISRTLGSLGGWKKNSVSDANRCGWAIGDVISFTCDGHYDNSATITNVVDNVITVDTLPFTLDDVPSTIISIGEANNKFDECSVFCVKKYNIGTVALGGSAFAIGTNTQASNAVAYAEGYNTVAYGKYSHAEGNETEAGYNAHAEGYKTKASGERSHAEGMENIAEGNCSHTEGRETSAVGNFSHAEGYKTRANGGASHAEGSSTEAGENAHSEGLRTKALGENSHSEGRDTVANRDSAHAEGQETQAIGTASHAEGVKTKASDWASHVEGYNCETGGNAAVNDKEIDEDNIEGQMAHAEGNSTIARGNASHAEGTKTIAVGKASHAEGNYTTASGTSSHAEGYSTKASGNYSHAEGYNTTASGTSSHAEGNYTTASGTSSHAEGYSTKASGNYSHAEGYETIANAAYSHAEGYWTITNNGAEHACGKFNVSNTGSTQADKTQFSVGIGTSENNRKNAHEITVDGKHYIYGLGGYYGTNLTDAKDLITALPIKSSTGDYSAIQDTDKTAFTDTNINSSTVNQEIPIEASGLYSLALGEDSNASGKRSLAHGHYSIARGTASHAEGQCCVIEEGGYASHAEGYSTLVSASYGHAEGTKTQVTGANSHAEGAETIAESENSHAEGYLSKTEGSSSHAEGNHTVTTGAYSHSEGFETKTVGQASHAEGQGSISQGDYSHAEGGFIVTETKYEFGLVSNDSTFTIYRLVKTDGTTESSNEEAYNKLNIEDTIYFNDDTYTITNKSISGTSYIITLDRAASVTVGGAHVYITEYTNPTTSQGFASHAEGASTTTIGGYSHAEGNSTTSSGNYSHAEGWVSNAIGESSHAEGQNTRAHGMACHSEGNNTDAYGYASHAEGLGTNASGQYSHAEGWVSNAIGECSHAEGQNTRAHGAVCHSEGNNTDAYGYANHTEGLGTKTNEGVLGQHAEGHFNFVGDGVLLVGCGTADDDRKNAIEVKQNGEIYIKGIGGYEGTNTTDAKDVATYLKNVVTKHTNIVEITYSDLVELEGIYVPGQQYRIIDYVTTTNQSYTQVANHQFDIIVTADDENTLSENARAIQHDGDTYFSNSDLNAWEIKYCLDNDTTRFAWATSSGKGVIYYMKDEYGNECPYDFKNIMFKHPNDTSTYPDYYYTFTNLISGTVSDKSITLYCYNNVIKEYINSLKLSLNNNVFINTSNTSYCHSNSFGYDCWNNSFEDDCTSNTFGNNCYSNSFGDVCYHNSFGNKCWDNSFGYNCDYNSFGNYCNYNSFGNYCYYNSFGNFCYSNTFGGGCNSNSFGNDCYYNSFGRDCWNNSFGNYCQHNSLNSYYRYIIFDNGNCYIKLNCTSTTSSSTRYQNVRIGLGVNNTTTYKIINDSNVGQTYETLYKPANSQTITI